jgi:prepilin-type N-terminal cleavage/methylation domain-containing protein
MKKEGFTLIELLVVISIIAILTGLAFSITIIAKKRSQLIQCMSNLRQIGLALRLYAQDWYGFAPPYSTEWSQLNQSYQLTAILSLYTKSKDIWFCPSDENIKWNKNQLQGTYGATSYAIPLRYSVMPIYIDSPPETLLIDLLPPWYGSNPVSLERKLRCPLCRAIVKDYMRWVYAHCFHHRGNGIVDLLVNGRVIITNASFPHSCPAPVPENWPFKNLP